MTRGRGSAAVYGTALIVSLALVGVGGAGLVGGPFTLALPLGIPWIGAHFRLDALSAVFMVIVNVGAAAASLYAIGYGRHEAEPGRVLPFYPVFLAAMNLVLLADDAYTFLFAWEVMSLASWALVMAHHLRPENARAGYVYLVMASLGTMALLLGFGLLAGASGGYLFAVMRVVHLPPVAAALVLGLVLLGAGSKAGLVPLHVWLPLAHPAAPSHVSALMSGVMTKVAVYAFVRVVFDLLGPPSWWWSMPVLVIGAATATLGVLHALMERDLKRLLAYSTIENIGIVFIGLGLALAFRANAMPGAAALALTASLFHAGNHMLFKSALFFGAGSVQVATGERDIERLGGLIHRMPVSAASMLVASMAISALPPLNGFASEWLAFQAIFASPVLPQWGLKLLIPGVGTLLAMSAALVAACFVRAFGIVYLGRARSDAAVDAREADWWSLAAMVLLAGLCVLAGLLPGVAIDAMAPAVQALTGARMPVQHLSPWQTIVPIADSRSSYNGLLVFCFVALVAGGAALLVRGRTRRARLWDCGYPGLGVLTQYSAASLSQPIRRVLGSVVFRSREVVVMPPPLDTAPAAIRKHIRDLVWDLLYAPVAGVVNAVAGLLNHLQFLTIRRYLGFVFAALVLLLLVLGVAG